MQAHPEGEDIRTSSHMTADVFHACQMSCTRGGAALSLILSNTTTTLLPICLFICLLDSCTAISIIPL
jgi:hypothetical protein